MEGTMRKTMHAMRAMTWISALILCLSIAVIAYALLEGGIWPEATGIDVKAKDSLTIDFSNAQDGYVMIHGPQTKSEMKLRVSLGKVTLMYDINSDGEYESFPLQLGAGDYKFELFQNVSGSKYAQAGTLSLSLEPSDDEVAFLSPNQYVYYTPESAAVQLSEELCEGLTTDEEKFEAIRTYICENFSYDFDKAATIKGGVLPDIDGLLETRKGICQDLSALAACMLRVQGIPTQMVIGYIGKYYHAWNSVMIDGEYRQLDLTDEIGALSGMKSRDYTVERFY